MEQENFINNKEQKHKMRKTFKNEIGITLIALVVTIVVFLMLAGVTVNLIVGNNGIIESANKIKIMVELSKYKEELEIFKLLKKVENEEFKEDSITAGETTLVYNTLEEGKNGSIYDVITSLKNSSLFGKMEIIKGELLINSQNMTEINVAKQLGILVNPYKIEEGVLLSSNTNLALMDSTGTVTIPEGVIAIGEGAFAKLSGLKTIIIPGTVKEIRKNAFNSNADLEKVILEEGIETIGEGAFAWCEKLTTIELPESLNSIGDEAFFYCTSLKEITIPAKIDIINTYSFNGCRNLTKVQLPESLKEIKNRAFSGCKKLDNIYISNNVNSIDTNAFEACENLANIEIGQNNVKYKYDKNSGMLTTTDGTIIFISGVVLKNITTFSIPEGILNFNIRLNNYKNITTIIIPKSLENLGTADNFPETISNVQITEGNNNFVVENYCLYNKEKTKLIMCYTKESTVTLADTLKNIGNYSFKQAVNIEDVAFPNSVTTIGSQVFDNRHTKLKNISIGENAISINPIFKYNKVGTVTIAGNNSKHSIEDNVLYNKDKTELISILGEIKGSYTIKSTVIKIGAYAFHNQNQMTEVILPKKLKEISSSFNYCNALTSIYIPNSVEIISSNAFNNSSNLEKIQIDKEPGSIEGAPWGAIKGDKVLEWLR